MATAEIRPPNPLEGLPMVAEDSTLASSQARRLSENQQPTADAADDEDEWSDADSNASDFDVLVNNDPLDFQYATETNDDVCTLTEAKELRARLLQLGEVNEFVRETLESGRYSARKLTTAFAFDLPEQLRGDVENYYAILGQLIIRELSVRRRLPEYTTLDHAAELLKKSNSILVITGAGISTPLGIPDFRSRDTGFYSRVRDFYDEPEDIFELGTFEREPKLFYQVAGDIFPDIARCSPTHHFIRLLQDKGKLLTNYTQNIDNIEHHAGIAPEKLVQCHGSWAKATCFQARGKSCGYVADGMTIFDDLKAQRVAKCPRCVERLAQGNGRPAQKRKRSTRGVQKARKRYSDEDTDSDGEHSIEEPGRMKPNITFFGEPLDDSFFNRVRDVDRHEVDLIIVIGTGMKVAPVSEIPNFIDPSIPQIYISREPVRHMNFDINLIGYADPICNELVKRAGWGELKHEMVPSGAEVAIELRDPEQDNVHLIKAADEQSWLNASRAASKKDSKEAQQEWMLLWGTPEEKAEIRKLQINDERPEV